MRDPNMQMYRKIGGKALTKSGESKAPGLKAHPILIEMVGVLNDDGTLDLSELEKKGILKTFLRNWNNPASIEQLKLLAARLKADGVDRRDKAAVKAWSEKHKDELASGTIKSGTAPRQKTVVNSGPSVGRNEPCPCGSKKKFKKCCEGK